MKTQTESPQFPTAEPVYVSGGITGVANYKEVFNKASNKLRKQNLKKVYNPATLASKDMEKVFAEVVQAKPSWLEYMILDIIILSHCKSIFMLRNWKTSKGARWEHRIMKWKKFFNPTIEIIYE